jgi:hypothetical protein
MYVNYIFIFFYTQNITTNILTSAIKQSIERGETIYEYIDSFKKIGDIAELATTEVSSKYGANLNQTSEYHVKEMCKDMIINNCSVECITGFYSIMKHCNFDELTYYNYDNTSIMRMKHNRDKICDFIEEYFYGDCE